MKATLIFYIVLREFVIYKNTDDQREIILIHGVNIVIDNNKSTSNSLNFDYLLY